MNEKLLYEDLTEKIINLKKAFCHRLSRTISDSKPVNLAGECEILPVSINILLLLSVLVRG